MRKPIFEMYSNGVTVNQIATKLGLAYSSIQASLKRDGIVFGSVYSVTKLSEDAKMQIAIEYESGKSMARIKSDFKIGHKLFRKVLKSFGVEFREKRRLSTVERMEAMDMIRNGSVIKDVCSFFGCSREALKIECKKRGVRRKWGMKIEKSLEDEICSDYLSGGKTIDDIGLKYKTNRTNVKALLDSRGIKTKLVNDRRSKAVKYQLNEDYFVSIDSHEKSYIVGMLFADGHVNKAMNTLKLNLVTPDRPLLRMIADEIEYTGPIFDMKPIIVAKTGNLSQPQSMLSIGSKKLIEPLAKIGVVSNKSLILKPPVGIPDEFINSFILGYFDGDGCIHLQKRKKYVPQASISFAGTFEVLDFISDNIVANTGVNKLPIRTLPNSRIFVMSWGGNNNAEKIFNYMYGGSSIFMKRKKDKFVECVEFVIRRRNKFNSIASEL